MKQYETINIANGNQYNENIPLLGRKLALDNKSMFKTWFGRCISLRAYIEFITIPGYPVKFVTKPPVKRVDYIKIPKKKVVLPNFYSLVCLGLIDKVKSDKELQKLLKENELPFSMVSSTEKDVEVFGNKLRLAIGEKKFIMYIQIVDTVSRLVKDDKLYDQEAVSKLVDSYKRALDEDIFKGVPFVLERSDRSTESSVEPITEEKE